MGAGFKLVSSPLSFSWPIACTALQVVKSLPTALIILYLEVIMTQQYRHVFSPLKIGNVEVKNRIEVPPMGTCLATPEGRVTPELIEHYKTFARGGAGIVVMADTAVDNEFGRAHFGLTHAGDDGAMAGLNAMAEAVGKYGAKISVELNHSGRLVNPNMLNGKNPIGPSAIVSEREERTARLEGRKPVPVMEMNRDMIERVVAHFADACFRCLQSGFEMVMLHGGHGQLLSQFASPFSNKRKDKYGGSLENRARFAVEVLSAIRKKVGDKLAIEYRISGDELIPGGMHLEETIEFIKIIEDKIDLVHVSVGGIFDIKYTPYMSQPTYFPYAFNAGRAEKIKKAIKIPVTCVGSVIDLAMADKIIADGKADMVAMGRALLADPELINKSLRGEIREVRPCIRCGICGTRSEKFQVRCVVNPVACREVEYKNIGIAEEKKNIVIVGGGPAGMQAALTASSRGHKVTLLEKENKLGGSLAAAAAPDFKPDMKRYLQWLIGKTERSGIKIKLATRATAAVIKALKPDVLIIAAGGGPAVPEIPGIKRPNVVTAVDVDLGSVKIGKRVVVVGAGMTGCETALHMAQKGIKVTLIDMLSEAEICSDTPLPNKIVLMDWLNKNGAEIITEVKLHEITDSGAVIIDTNRKRTKIPADTIVLASGVTPHSKLVKELKAVAPESYVIGDCLKPRNLMGAVHDGFNVAAEI